MKKPSSSEQEGATYLHWHTGTSVSIVKDQLRLSLHCMYYKVFHTHSAVHTKSCCSLSDFTYFTNYTKWGAWSTKLPLSCVEGDLFSLERISTQLRTSLWRFFCISTDDEGCLDLDTGDFEKRQNIGWINLGPKHCWQL